MPFPTNMGCVYVVFSGIVVSSPEGNCPVAFHWAVFCEWNCEWNAFDMRLQSIQRARNSNRSAVDIFLHKITLEQLVGIIASMRLEIE
jgi:hypothetical protein